jgi:hypothetical protein
MQVGFASLTYRSASLHSQPKNSLKRRRSGRVSPHNWAFGGDQGSDVTSSFCLFRGDAEALSCCLAGALVFQRLPGDVGAGRWSGIEEVAPTDAFRPSGWVMWRCGLSVRDLILGDISFLFLKLITRKWIIWFGSFKKKKRQLYFGLIWFDRVNDHGGRSLGHFWYRMWLSP